MLWWWCVLISSAECEDYCAIDLSLLVSLNGALVNKMSSAFHYEMYLFLQLDNQKILIMLQQKFYFDNSHLLNIPCGINMSKKEPDFFFNINEMFQFHPNFYPLFKVQDCHVIKYLPKEEYDGHTAALVVGGKNASPFCVRIPHYKK